MKKILLFCILLGASAYAAPAIAHLDDPDDNEVEYWLVGKIPSGWLVDVIKEKNEDLWSGFGLSKLLAFGSGQVKAQCVWYEFNDLTENKMKRTAFIVSKNKSDAMWKTYQDVFSKPSDKSRWAQGLSALCMYNHEKVGSELLAFNPKKFVPKEIPIVVSKVQHEDYWTIEVKPKK